MKYIIITICALTSLVSCSKKEVKTPSKFTIAFGSCNNQDLENTLWQEIAKHNPDVWIWGGDNVYADTKDMNEMEAKYQKQKSHPQYAEFIKSRTVLGVWDDHDYGVNDGGEEFEKKVEAQQLFLNFFDVPKNDERRNREGTYHNEVFNAGEYSINIILLDTRYFRTPLNRNTTPEDRSVFYKRYSPNKYGEGTLLGSQQWQWLENTLETNSTDFTIIVSSIQVLSGEHGWETWANMPHEIDKLEKLLIETQTKNTIILSGDRHISDFSKNEVEGLPYPVIDFTSSGLTHSATMNKGEPNKYRIGNLVNQPSYGLITLNLDRKEAIMEMRGVKDSVQQNHVQKY
ncbi:hypothetical protein KH5_21360 [Urechidicola sp. KH5]